MVLANIVSNNDLNTSSDFKVVSSIDNIIDGLPTLIVGYDNVKKYFPDFDITSNKISEDVYWTFKKNEKRDKYQEDLNFFTKKVYTDLINDLSYVFVDPIHYGKKSMKKILRKIYSSNIIVSYEHDDMIYIYADKIIFGVDLKLLKFIGFNILKVKTKIKSISTVFLEKNEILIDYKIIMSFFDNKFRYLPYLYFIKNEQNFTSSLFYISRKT